MDDDEEMTSGRKRRQQGKQPPDEEKKRIQNETWTKDWLEDWLTDDTHQHEPTLDECGYERAVVNESLPELLETKRLLFWNP